MKLVIVALLSAGLAFFLLTYFIIPWLLDLAL
jgi:hypothetical protein